MKVEFVGELLVDERGDSEHVLISPFIARVTEEGAAQVDVVVPAGFATDYTSVPRAAGAAYNLFGNTGNKAATVHDFLYSPPGTYPREWADAVLRAGLIAQGIEEWKADAMYAAVREFGGDHYNQA